MVVYKRGAEAELSILDTPEGTVLLKQRSPKQYRNALLDTKLRAERTRAEAKLIKTAASVVPVPRIISVDAKKGELVMEYIDGPALKKVLAQKSALCTTAGTHIRKLHDLGVIHGDLTTSNILVRKKRGTPKGAPHDELVFIDFGLGFFSKKVEDKATDLVVFKKTFNATHSGIKNGWERVMQGYAPTQELVTRMSAIEKRARYH